MGVLHLLSRDRSLYILVQDPSVSTDRLGWLPPLPLCSSSSLSSKRREGPVTCHMIWDGVTPGLDCYFQNVILICVCVCVLTAPWSPACWPFKPRVCWNIFFLVICICYLCKLDLRASFHLLIFWKLWESFQVSACLSTFSRKLVEELGSLESQPISTGEGKLYKRERDGWFLLFSLCWLM